MINKICLLVLKQLEHFCAPKNDYERYEMKSLMSQNDVNLLMYMKLKVLRCQKGQKFKIGFGSQHF